MGEGLPVATRSHGLTRGDVPKWEQAFDLGAVASSPVRTESYAELDDPASLHVTVRVQRPHVSGRRRTNTNSALYPFRGGVRHVVHPARIAAPVLWRGCVDAWLCRSSTVWGLARGRARWVAGQIWNRLDPVSECPQWSIGTRHVTWDGPLFDQVRRGQAGAKGPQVDFVSGPVVVRRVLMTNWKSGSSFMPGRASIASGTSWSSPGGRPVSPPSTPLGWQLCCFGVALNPSAVKSTLPESG